MGGEWWSNEEGGYVCSQCGSWFDDYFGGEPPKECSSCGSKMIVNEEYEVDRHGTLSKGLKLLELKDYPHWLKSKEVK